MWTHRAAAAIPGALTVGQVQVAQPQVVLEVIQVWIPGANGLDTA